MRSFKQAVYSAHMSEFWLIFIVLLELTYLKKKRINIRKNRENIKSGTIPIHVFFSVYPRYHSRTPHRGEPPPKWSAFNLGLNYTE